MTAIGVEIQNRCEAIKQNYTSIFDDRSNRFWVVVPLTIFAAATAQTSLVPLLFIAGMFFLGLLTSGWRAAVAAMLLNLVYTRVENKTDAQLREIVCSNLGENRYVITDAKGFDYANVLSF